MTKGIFVTATDTEVGKTFVSCLIARGFMSRGVQTTVVKPVATGGQKIGGRLVSPDSIFLKKHVPLDAAYHEINPLCLKAALAPSVAARIEKRKISIPCILNAVRALQEEYEFLVVEGIGGVDVPIAGDYLVRDLIRDVGFPALIVARPALGTINHTLLTVNELSRNGIEVAGIVINQAKGSKSGLAGKTSPAVIGGISGVPVLCEVPFMKNINGGRAQAAGERLYAALAGSRVMKQRA
jgi:dethiobiotin synthetase